MEENSNNIITNLIENTATEPSVYNVCYNIYTVVSVIAFTVIVFSVYRYLKNVLKDRK